MSPKVLCCDRAALMVLAVSLVLDDIGVGRRAAASWTGDVRGRPLGASSEDRPPSVEGRLGFGDGCPVGALIFGCSHEVPSACPFPEELGLVGGEGGAAPWGMAWTLPAGNEGCSQANEACGMLSKGTDLRTVLPLGRENLE